MNYPAVEQQGILKCIERSKGRGYLSALFMAGLSALFMAGLSALFMAGLSALFMAGLSAFYQPFTSLWLVGWLED